MEPGLQTLDKKGSALGAQDSQTDDEAFIPDLPSPAQRKIVFHETQFFPLQTQSNIYGLLNIQVRGLNKMVVATLGGEIFCLEYHKPSVQRPPSLTPITYQCQTMASDDCKSSGSDNICQSEQQHRPRKRKSEEILLDKEVVTISRSKKFRGSVMGGNYSPFSANFEPTKFMTGAQYWRIGNCNTPIATIKGSGIIIGILDTGICYDTCSKVNLINDDSSNIIEQEYRHGSAVAIVAAGFLQVPVDGASYTYGVAPDAKLDIFKIAPPYDALEILEALQSIEDRNLDDLVVMPFSLPKITFEMEDMIERLISQLQLKGVICVVAAGNSGKNASPKFPATSGNVITVGSVNSSGRISSFSADDDCVDVFAPGEDILLGFADDGCPICDSGTSYAAPAVAALIARLFQCARVYGDDYTLIRLRNVHRLKKFLKKNLCRDRLLQPEKVSDFFMKKVKDIQKLAIEIH